MNKLIIIPARGGSKGLPGKNIKLLVDRPLIKYTIDCARDLFNDDIICVSTDSQDIIDYVLEIGLKVPFKRPSILSTDSSSSYDVILHTLKYYESIGYFPDIIILLQPTSPLRTSKHISEALDLYNNDIDMVASVKKTSSNPYFVLFEENNEGFLKKSKDSNFTSRQECPLVWEFNGAIYIINVNSFKHQKSLNFSKIRKYTMESESSIDIDTLEDFMLAEFYIKNKK